MIEVFLAGHYLGTPHDIGAWAYALRRGEEILGEGKGSDRPAVITCRLATEAAGLALALEDLIQNWAGEDVVVRTGSAGLEGLLLRQGKGVSRDLARWYARARAAAGHCSSLRILAVPHGELARLRTTAEKLLPATPSGIKIARASDLSIGKETRP